MKFSGRFNGPDFLLHLCCAPCSPHPIDVLKKDYKVTLYFYNPNIYPETEYESRLDEVKKLAVIENLPLITGDYYPDLWIKDKEKLRDEPEKGKRCELCIGDRMMQTARTAARLDMENFGAVLSVSPHKDALMINSLGRKAQKILNRDGTDIVFFEADWKKKEGFKISSRISRNMGFVRQDYCGCVYSRGRMKRKLPGAFI
ncbi:MAG: hypothetical protein IEMM0002_0950 [bacterium]|nr:MAG: hypothetical protein IEMM0002_0950 [bacterium]